LCSIETCNDLIVEFAVLLQCLLLSALIHCGCGGFSSPLNCKTLKHVSAFMVICLGGGAGNESVYAEDVPKGRVIILLDWSMCVVGLIV